MRNTEIGFGDKYDMKNFLTSLKAIFNKDICYTALDHLKDYKLVYSVVTLVTSVLGMTVASDKVSLAITNAAGILSSIAHSTLG